MPIRQQSSIPNLIISAHTPKFIVFMKVKVGDIVTVGKEDDEYPGWLWCTDSHGISNWVPKEMLKLCENPSMGEFLVDYDATELTVKVGETVTVYGEQSGWLWCHSMQKQWGWIPKECIG